MYKLIQNKKIWIILLIALILISVIRFTSSNRIEITFLEKAIREAFTPLQSGVNEFGDRFSFITTTFTDKKLIIKKNAELEEQLRNIRIENYELYEYKYEAQRLISLLDLKEQRQEFDLLSARVIARSPSNWYQTITINKGSKHGVKINMPVINVDGLVGRIVSVSPSSSQLYLLSDREVAVGVIIQKTRETNGVVEGLGKNELLRMINIPYYSTVEIDDIVITSGLSEIYPKGIMVGKVSSVTREPNGLLLSAMIEPAVNFDTLEEIFIILDYRSLPENNEDIIEEEME